ncbi:malto-oligosyltrehalose trehalohydrolase [Agromyces atrinae]|uniref:malto-oligosyltrehalose trehalohydrolase n=1 Tax=Agromyces atrinae TaxID=592376 RepID=UPI001F55E6C2|nr:malto-oligosyltrehalose trehalohydrolase [Agromyces atrinae]MCI2956578.1 malto-oligosyltrehalose trehalohydrolase [Agromyces atrinae]
MSGVFSVWAPHASVVELDRDGDRSVLARDLTRPGWWHAPHLIAEHGDEYAFVVDGQGPFADPRSRRQPHGVHGATRIERSEPTSDTNWAGRDLVGAVGYELHIGTFTPGGTLDSAIERLDHLAGLGIDYVELLPVNAFNGDRGWGYDGVFWFAVHEAYGGPDAYRRFVAACHERGLAVVQDVVYNHLGPSGNVLGRFGPYLSDGDGPWGSGVNLDGPDSDEVRAYIIDNALLWIEEYGVDGLRLDAVHALHDSRAVHLLEELAERVDDAASRLGRPVTLIAESDLNDPRMITAREPGGRGGHGLGAQWDDDVHHALHVALTGETSGYYADFASLDSLAYVLENGFFHDGSYSSFRGRHHGRPIDRSTTPPSRLVVSSQNHDQIGNRAAGDRLTATVSEGRLAIAAALTLLGPFSPLLFMGEEWAASTPWQYFTSHPEPDLGRAVVEGRTNEFARMGWDPALVPDPQDPETFRRSTLDWSEPGGEKHARMLDWYRRLTAIRRAVRTAPGFRDDFAAVQAEVDASSGLVRLEFGAVRVLAHLGDGELAIGSEPAASIEEFFGALRTGDTLVLGPDGVAILVS